jgi:TPR repeat protein
MMRLSGRGGTANRELAVKLLASSAKLGNAKAAYNLALLYLDGNTLPQDVRRAAELLRVAADAGNAEAQYALATFYKDGRGVKQDINEATRWMGTAARSGYTDAEVEYGIALFNGTGTAKNERAAGEYFMKAARKNSAPAQSRLALMYAIGKGLKADPVEATRWHLIARAGGANDQYLEDYVRKLKPADRTAGEDKAKPWIARMKVAGPSPFPDPEPAKQ